MAVAVKDNSSQWVIRLLGALMILALAYLVVKVVITFTNPETAWKQPAIVPSAVQNIPTQGRQNYSFTSDPFNRNVAIEVTAMAEVGEDAPETTLNLKLTGRTAGSNGTAILRTPDSKEGNFRIGDEVIPGVTLQAVNKDFIVLDVDGQIQRLTFDRGDDTGLMKSPADGDKGSQITGSKTASKALAVAAQQTAASGDVSALFQNISLRRVMKNGQLAGYSVKANRPGVSLAPFGFSKGDIVTAIGDTDITRGRPDFIALLQDAAKNGGAEVTVLRNGQVKTIKLGTP